MRQITNILRRVKTALQTRLQRSVHIPLKGGDRLSILYFFQKKGWPYIQTGDHSFLLYVPKPLSKGTLEKLNHVSQATWTICYQYVQWKAIQSVSESVYGGHNAHIEALLRQAFTLRTSDIFLTLNEKMVTLRFRHQRVLGPTIHLSLNKGSALLKSLLVLSHLNIDETLREQEGHFRYSLGGKLIFCRLSYLASPVSQSLVLRLLSEDLFPFDVTALNLPQDLQRLLCIQPWNAGMILISGATGSGKTTTLYALGKLLYQQSKKIISIEDPIEAEMDLWLQTEIDSRCGYTFDMALKAVLRQDPNVILLGEIRDSETAQAAFYASLSGYLVVTTLHAQSLEQVPIRCKELGIDFATFKDNIRLQIHQQWPDDRTSSPLFTWEKPQ